MVTQLAVGTPVYMAPEYMNMGIISPALDIFSFGVVLLELLTGLHPAKSMLPELVGEVVEDADASGSHGQAVQRAAQLGGHFDSKDVAIAEVLDLPPGQRKHKRDKDGRAVADPTSVNVTTKVAGWRGGTGFALAKLAIECTNRHAKKRPGVGAVLQRLKQLCAPRLRA